MTKHPLFSTWHNMKQRCYNPNIGHYADYGGRGIFVCERWLTSLDAFAEDMGPRPPGMTLDRIDNDGPYSPENCRWATQSEQAFNRRPAAIADASDSRTRALTFDGRTLSVREWSQEIGVPAPVIRDRLDKCHWSVEKALSTPLRKRRDNRSLGAR